MNIALIAPDADVTAASAQFEARTPKNQGETAAEHLERALQAQLDAELVAARKLAADAVIVAAKNDTELASALLARQKIA